MTHTFDYEVSLHSWLLWPTVGHAIQQMDDETGFKADLKLAAAV